MQNFDIIIIGTGAGSKLRALTEKWYRVAIVENNALGGTCLNRGCIPSKRLIYPSDLQTHIVRDSKKLHIEGQIPHLNFSELIQETSNHVDTESASIWDFYATEEHLALFRETARFVSNNVIQVGNEEITAPKIYIATGSKPQIPPTPGLSDTPYMTSREALRATELPKKLIVIGWGYIACELWHVYSAAGSEVHFLVRGELLKNEDKNIREAFSADFSAHHHVHYGVDILSVAYREDIFYVTIQQDGITKTLESNWLLVATGVVPMTEWLGIENTDITLDKRGFIEVDNFLETRVKWVFALGDVIGNYLFRHAGNFEGEYLIRSQFENPEPFPIVYPPMPHAVFSYPQIGSVGPTEDELIKKWLKEDLDYIVWITQYKEVAMWGAMKSETWLVKLIADAKSGKIIAWHILWEKSADLIHTIVAVVSAKMDISFLLEEMIFIHPALAETIRSAAKKIKQKHKNLSL